MATVDRMMIDEGPSIYYDKAFRQVLEDHMTFLRTHPSTVVKPIDAGKAYQYANNWYGLLRLYGVPEELHWVTLRMNGRTSPGESLDGVEVILVPERNTVDHIRQSYTSVNRIT